MYRGSDASNRPNFAHFLYLYYNKAGFLITNKMLLITKHLMIITLYLVISSPTESMLISSPSESCFEKVAQLRNQSIQERKNQKTELRALVSLATKQQEMNSFLIALLNVLVETDDISRNLILIRNFIT